MEKVKTRLNIIICLIILLVVGSVYLAFPVENDNPIGSVSQNNQYESTQLTGAVATTSVIMAGIGTLGSVIITEDQAGAVVLWDASSTAAVTESGLSERIADFQAASTEGVYTFDVGLKYGLVFVSDDGYSFAGDWTITYRSGW